MFFQIPRISLFIVIAVTLQVQFVFAQASLFSLQSLLDDVYKTHPFFKSTATQKDMAKLAILKERSFTDTAYSLAPSFSYSKPVSSSPFQAQKTSTFGVQSSLSKTLWSTGGTLGASLGLNATDSSYSSQAQQFGLLSNYYQHVIGLSYIHPLLKNKEGVLNKIGTKTKTLDYQRTLIQLADQEQQFILGLINQFLDWYGHYRELANLRDRYAISKTLYTDTSKKYNKNIAERVDLIQSEDSLKNLEQLIILQQGKVDSKINQLSLIVSYPIRDKIPKLKLSYVPTLPTITNDMLSRVPHIALLYQQKDLLEFQKAMLTEQHRPNLNLNLAANLKSGDTSLGDSLGFNKPDYTVSVTYAHSIEQTSYHIDDQMLQRSIDTTQLAIDSAILTLKSSLVDISTQYQSLIDVIASNETRLVLAKKRVQQEIKRYNHGRGQFSFVVQAQDNIQFIETILLQNKISIYRLYIQYTTSLGLLEEALTILNNEKII
ncbi:hypothetical protein DID74_02275 [Candidatus Marinamargulisbacteria bacterium SCGC AG-333-B06]|nr:hypothetical protein DID74_02275 [Candidatus Marinamargulisbacteria bacterium SCGC AG-333-B06]